MAARAMISSVTNTEVEIKPHADVDRNRLNGSWSRGNLNTCPVGVATQDPALRRLFSGKPENVMNFMLFVAEETRGIMASLGFRTVEEMVGMVEVLNVNEAIDHWKAKGLDFSRVFAVPQIPPAGLAANASNGSPPGAGSGDSQEMRRCTAKQVHDQSLSLDGELIAQSKVALDKKEPVRLYASIRNCNRTVGATLSSEVSKRHGEAGLPADTITCKFTGSAGQSFGAFLAPGISFELEGDANDYFGKGLSGGKIVVYPHKASSFRPQNNIITGNVNLFGATRGEVYINGMAGERFAVRNSGATAVVEGVGDHACEYMTGGLVVVLGKTGLNFAAGMSGGIAYVLDEDQLFDTMCNLEMVDIEPVTTEEDAELLYRLICNHVNFTGSEYAARLIRDWTALSPQFVKVIPTEYRRALERLQKAESKETEVVALTEEVYR